MTMGAGGLAEFADETLESNPARWSSKRASIDALLWLASTTSARILNIFDMACNLINARGEMLALVAPEIGLGPHNLILPSINNSGDSLIPFSRWMKLSSAVHVTDEELSVEALVVAFRDAQPWDSRVPWKAIRSRRNELLGKISCIAAFAKHYPMEGSLLDFVPQLVHGEAIKASENAQMHARLLAAAWKPASLLCLGIRNDDIALCREGAAGLAGMGVGSTPSGDDFVIGALYAMRILHSARRSSELASAMLAEMVSRTNRLSRIWLEAAAEGKAVEAWHDLLGELGNSSNLSIECSVGRILKVGHTSGADALAGFIAVLAAKA